MDEQQQNELRQAIARHEEVFEALVARKGDEYAVKVTTFVACEKLFLARQPTREDFLGFCTALLDSMEIRTVSQKHEFVCEATIIRKAQQVKL